MQIYVDESGDLGFSGTGSRFMVVAFIAAADNKISRRIKKIVLGIKNDLRLKGTDEIKAYNSTSETRLRMCRELAELDISVQYVSMLKDKVYAQLRTDTNILYNYIAGLLLIPCIVPLKRAHICFDKRIIKVSSGRSLADYIRLKAWAECQSNCEISIQDLESHRCSALQAADFVSNAIFRYYEHGDYDCYRCLLPRIQKKQTLYF